MESTRTNGAISAQEEFFYPDMALAPLPAELHLAMPRNGRPGVQLLVETDEPRLTASLESADFTPEFFCELAVPVEYNTGDGVEQGGSMVLESRPAQKPSYATRLAPFAVYDCLKPAPGGHIEAENGRAALYLCLCPRPDIRPGEHHALLRLGAYCCRLVIRVYGVEIPQDAFPVTNWFSLESICRFHHLEPDSPAFYEMVRQYARAMRRIHQTMFYIQLDGRCVVSREPYQFNFEYLRPLIELFFESGMQKMELGSLLSRGLLPDGAPDMYTDRFKCSMAPDVPVDSPHGYEIIVRFVQALAAFLGKYGWQDKVLFHIHDEPDIHFKDEATLLARKRQYYLAASVLRKYLPGVRIIEAVASPEFRGGVDVWVPGTAGYEANKSAFDRFIGLGESVWAYVCCGPEGGWLNRFLDFASIKGRLLFWGCAANRLGGFLHWGFNQFPAGMDPFKATSCPNDTGIGTNFPCGDSFIVYPGADGPWPGMRMEAARRGAEDAALLMLLRQRNEAAHDELVAQVFRDNQHYNDDPAFFETVYEELLRLLAREEAKK